MEHYKIELKHFDTKKNYKAQTKEMKKQTMVKYNFYTKPIKTTDRRQFISNSGMYSLESELRNIYTETQILDIVKLKTTWREVLNIKFNLKFDFVPGDAISLIVPNADALVAKLLNSIKKNGSEIIEIIHMKKGNNFTFCGTLKDFFTHVYDLRQFMKKNFLYDLAQVSEFSEELYYLISKDGSYDYFNIFSNLCTVCDIIERFDCKVTLDILLENTEFLKPRHYSLINKKSDFAEIIAGLCYVENEKRIYGHVSNYLKYANVNDIVLCALKKNKLLNLREHKNIIMIATGTGIAPFISFVRNAPDRNYWLIYACRKEKDDLSNILDIKKTILMSSKGDNIKKYICDNIKTIEEHTKSDCAIYVCANDILTKYLISFFKENLSEMYDSKNIFFDLWI